MVFLDLFVQLHFGFLKSVQIINVYRVKFIKQFFPKFNWIQLDNVVINVI